MDDEPLYLSRLHPQDRKTIERLTAHKNWSSGDFSKALYLASLTSSYILAPNRPDSIHLQNLREPIEELKARTRQDGNEYARALFVSTETQNFVWSNKTTRGSSDHVRVDWALPPEKQASLKKAFAAHIHPERPSGIVDIVGFSEADYLHFLADRDQQGLYMGWKDYDFLVLKTSATPNNITLESAKKKINDASQDIREEYAGKPSAIIGTEINKEVCRQFGLVLYVAPPENRDLAERVSLA